VLYPKLAKLLTIQAAVRLLEIKALVNRDLQLNLISKTFINEQKLKLVLILELLAKAVNSLEILIYSITTTDITITDSRERKETHIVPFVVIDLQRY
jgi:hypothetical protein